MCKAGEKKHFPPVCVLLALWKEKPSPQGLLYVGHQNPLHFITAIDKKPCNML